MSKKKTIFQKLMAIFFLPVVVYLVMLLVCTANNNSYNIFDPDILIIVLRKTSYMAIIALGIGFQLGYGRFDFSGGAITVIAAMVATKVYLATNIGVLPFMLIAIAVAIVASVLHSIIYVYVKVPISVISLGTSFLLEALSGLIVTDTINIQESSVAILAKSYLFLIPLALAMVASYTFQTFTVPGRQATLLAKNQLSAVNIGINETKNTIITYVVSGFIFGCAASLYAVTNFLNPITTPLSTAGTLFGNIIPSLVGLFLSRFIDGNLGTFVGALTIQLLYTGLDSNGISGGVKTIFYAIFLAIFIFISGFWDQMIAAIKDFFRKLTKKSNKEAAK